MACQVAIKTGAGANCDAATAKSAPGSEESDALSKMPCITGGVCPQAPLCLHVPVYFTCRVQYQTCLNHDERWHFGTLPAGAHKEAKTAPDLALKKTGAKAVTGRHSCQCCQQHFGFWLLMLQLHIEICLVFHYTPSAKLIACLVSGRHDTSSRPAKPGAH